MELLNTLSLQFIYFGAGLSVLMVIGQLYYSRQEGAAPSNPYLSLIGITAFSILTRIALYLEQFRPNSWWYFTLFAFVC